MTAGMAGELALVVGYGRSGRAAARVLLEEGAEVRVSESRPAESLEPPEGGDAEDGAVEVLAGGHRPQHLDGVTVVVTSPGVPEGAPILQWARHRGVPIWSELELGARLCRVPFVAVTGTNGKTTTVELVAAMMRAAGLAAVACGNVGHPFSLAVKEEHQALAVEASSFQLRFHQSFHPQVSVLLNLAPDHIDWHGSFEAYAAAKARIFALQEGDDVHVGNRDDPVAARVSSGARCALRWFGARARGPGDVALYGGGIAVIAPDGGRVELGGPPTGVPLSLHMDAVAAAAAGLAFGLSPQAVGAALAGFDVLPHRGTVVAEAAGVRFVDDSKATNPHAALASLEGRTDVVLIAGGLAKGVDLSPLAQAASQLSAVVAIGEAAPRLAEVFRGLVPVVQARSIEEAVEVAFDHARPGGTVLLAPACASQDMFRDYRERGRRFVAAARALVTPQAPDHARSNHAR